MSLRIITAFLICFLPTTSFAAADMFIKIKGIMGESKDAVHKDEIDVLSWSWGATSDGRNTCVQDLSFVKFVDNGSPDLLMGQIENRVYDDAVLTVRRAGDRPVEYLIITFERVIVTSVSTGGSGAADRLTENVTLKFGQAEYQYTKQNDDGTAGETKTATIFPSSRCK